MDLVQKGTFEEKYQILNIEKRFHGEYIEREENRAKYCNEEYEEKSIVSVPL